MAIAFHMQFPKTTQAQYDQVMKELNLKDNQPAGLISHVAGPMESDWCVMDVWESQASFDKFYKERLQRALENARIGPPRPTSFNVYNTMGLSVHARR